MNTTLNHPKFGALTTIRFLILNIFPSSPDTFMVPYGFVCADGSLSGVNRLSI
jgi:hypothetical protein